MLKSLKKLWKDAAASPAAGKKAHSLELSVAALMVEIMRVDGTVDEAERREIVAQLQKNFDLSLAGSVNLIDQALLESEQALDMHQFTSRIIKGFTPEEREGVLKQLWHVAMADGHIDPYEEQLIRRTADLLGIHHRQFIEAKLSAAKEA